MKKKQNRSPRVNFSMEPAYLDKLRKLAKHNSRTMKAQLELLIDAEMLY